MLPLILPKNPQINIDLFFILCIFSTPAYAGGHTLIAASHHPGGKTIATLIIPPPKYSQALLPIVLTDVSPTCFFEHGLNQGFGITGSQ
jgi:hypothetical protein